MPRQSSARSAHLVSPFQRWAASLDAVLTPQCRWTTYGKSTRHVNKYVSSGEGGDVTFERYGQLSSWPGPCRARGGGRDLPPLRQAALPTRCNRLGRRPSAPPKNKRGTATQRPGSADHAAHGAHTILAVPRAHLLAVRTPSAPPKEPKGNRDATPGKYRSRCPRYPHDLSRASSAPPRRTSRERTSILCGVWSNGQMPHTIGEPHTIFEANMESQHGGRGIMRVQPVVLYVLLPTSWSGRIYVHCIIFVWRDTSEPARRGANCTSEPVLVVGWA